MIASVFALFCTRSPRIQGYREHFHHKLHSTGVGNTVSKHRSGAGSCRQTGAPAPRHPRQQGFVRNRSSGVARLCPDKGGMPLGAVCAADWGSTTFRCLQLSSDSYWRRNTRIRIIIHQLEILIPEIEDTLY